VGVSSLSPGWWAYHPNPPRPRSIVELLRGGTLDAELAALLWLLVEARLPLIAAAERSGAGKTTLLGAMLDFLPPGTRRIELRGIDEDFAWLPHAAELGWPGRPDPALAARERTTPGSAYLLAAELSDHHPHYTWGDAARVALRALSIGYGLGATVHADSLEEVFDLLHRPPVAVTDDELSRLGVVLVLRAVAPPPGDVAAGSLRRIVAAHYVRPVSRDAHGHIQRLPPAVLATWDPHADRFEHFAWGIMAELAGRVGRRTGDFAAEHERRRDYLAGLAEAGVVEVDDVRAALDGYRSIATTHPH
jgi:flagellar protein FlaI